MSQITTVLVANRGEIAVRVMRTAKAMGLTTVAVYSDADSDALHVRSADKAVRIGPAQASESYLCIDAILNAAAQTGADAIHPGYGFLSENQAFAAACEQAGIIFIGPPRHAIDVMGDKARAKRAMIEAGVPCIPGYQGEDQSLDTLLSQANEIGMPVMIKAAAGGGGRGMRLVNDSTQLATAIGLAQSEAENAFGSRELIIEKAVVRPRHVEIQVFADSHGQVIHLGERDCSIQRRHQKVVEESPCPVMTPELRDAMGAAAVEAARAVNYVGAGTVEFLLDSEGQFYFLEMNTRLQVEHPVTELVTAQDLVEWQLRVARGEPLPVSQDAIVLSGHAIEVRLYAEDPGAGFLPATGSVRQFFTPDRVGLRVDTGVESGDEVSPFYDPMVAKVIGYGDTREDARRRLLAGLREAALLGVGNNRDFLLDVLAQPVFANGEATTAFIEDHYGDRFTSPAAGSRELAIAATILHLESLTRHHRGALSVSEELLDWSSAGRIACTHQFLVGDLTHTVILQSDGPGSYEVSADGETHWIDVEELGEGSALFVLDGLREQLRYELESPATLHFSCAARTLTLTDLARLPPESEDSGAGGNVLAPMHGQLLSIDVEATQAVTRGQRLAVLEAMKMQHEIIATVDGVVTDVIASAGKQIAAGDLVLVIEEDT